MSVSSFWLRDVKDFTLKVIEVVCQVHFLSAVLNPSVSEFMLLTILYPPPLNFYTFDSAVKVQIFKLGIPRFFM